MFKWRSAYGVGLAAIVLSACSPAMREWWTEDLRDRRPVLVWNQPAPYFAPMPSDDAELQTRTPTPSAPGNAGQRTVARAPVSTAPPIGERARASDVVARAPTYRVPQSAPRPASPVRPPLREPANFPPSAPSAALVPESAPVEAPVETPSEVPIVPAAVASLAGMSEAEVRRVLGPPRTQTEKGSQKKWTYAGEGCSVEVVFFLDVTRDAYAALDHKTLGADGRTRSSQPCLQLNASLSRNAP